MFWLQEKFRTFCNMGRLTKGNICISTYRMAIGTFNINKAYTFSSPDKYKKLSHSFELFLKCFSQFPRIITYLFVSILNIFLASLKEIHKNAKIVVLCLFICRYKIDFQKMICFFLIFNFIIGGFIALESSPLFSLFSNRNSVLLVMFFAFHLIAFVPVTQNKYHFRSQIWL